MQQELSMWIQATIGFVSSNTKPKQIYFVQEINLEEYFLPG